MRVNGLYGHVRRNDVRSVLLFAGFVAAFHLLAALALVVPLAMLDPKHAPLYGWTGYLMRWVPIVTVLGALCFAVQMAWHVRTVRRRTDFRFVDNHDEPRLCRIVEPLAIAAGLPTPYVGVIDSRALNAFACGIRQKDAVLVFTRGLIDGLDDDELAAVAAHEIMHIVNGDIRLIAATNVCLGTLKLLQQRDRKRANRIWEAMTLPILALALPLVVVLILVVLFLRRLAVDASHLTRLLIASAREFIADAEAVRLTQNPAALVSALQRIEGRSAIAGLAAGQDAMMIDGAHRGPFATHPTIGERIKALVAVTGSMALVAPERRDTRSVEMRASGGFGRNTGLGVEAAFGRAVRQRPAASLARASATGDTNRLGLTREMTVGAIAACGAFVWMHGAQLGNPAAMAKAFDPAPMRVFFALGGQGMRCQLQGFGWLAGLAEKPTGCSDVRMNELAAGLRTEGGLVGMMAESMAGQTSGTDERSDGTFSNVPPVHVQIAQTRDQRCYQTDGYGVGDRGLRSVTKKPREHDNINLPRWLAHADDVASRAISANAGERDAALLGYFETRKTLGQSIHRFFGEPGLQVAAVRFDQPVHSNAVAAIRDRLRNPAFASRVSQLERAELELLAGSPQDFITCKARRDRGRSSPGTQDVGTELQTAG
jgi:Zn-dependent protease with chaperone function